MIETSTLLRRLPPEYRSDGLVTAIQAAYRYGYANTLWSKKEAVGVVFREVMESAMAFGKGHRAQRRANAFGLVSTEYGVGRMNAKGHLERAFGIQVSPKPVQIRPASLYEIARYFSARASAAETLTNYYNSRDWTGD